MKSVQKISETTQDRILEKSFLNGIGLATAPWAEVTDRASLDAAIANARLEEVGKLIRDGAFTFLKREYRILGIFAAVVICFLS